MAHQSISLDLDYINQTVLALRTHIRTYAEYKTRMTVFSYDDQMRFMHKYLNPEWDTIESGLKEFDEYITSLKLGITPSKATSLVNHLVFIPGIDRSGLAGRTTYRPTGIVDEILYRMYTTFPGNYRSFDYE